MNDDEERLRDLERHAAQCDLLHASQKEINVALFARVEKVESRISDIERKIAWVCGASAGVGALLGSGLFRLIS